MKHFLLFYEFGPDYFERRAEVMPPHVAYLHKMAESGELVLGGAHVEGRTVQGVYLLKVESLEGVEAFAKADPYISSGLATGWRAMEWHTIAGRDALVKS